MEQISLEDLPSLVGQVDISEWVSVTQERVNRFAEATGDFNWIHIDVERATKENGGTIAHGYLTLSLIPQLNDGLFELTGVKRALNYGSNKVRYTNTVKVGRRVRLHSTILSAEPKAGGVLVQRECKIEIEGEQKPACLAETLTLYFPL